MEKDIKMYLGVEGKPENCETEERYDTSKKFLLLSGVAI
jgi:hypothetical protein